MPHRRLAGFTAAVASLLAAAAAVAAVAVDAIAPMNVTVTGEVPAGGRPYVVGVLVASGTTKGSLSAKAIAGSTVVPRISLVAPDGTVRDADDLVALGATVKSTTKSMSFKNVPFDQTGLWKAVVAGADGLDGKPTAGGFTFKLGGKAPAGLTAPPAAIATQLEKDDYVIQACENCSFSATLKPSKAAPFSVSLKLLAASGDEIDFTPWVKIGADESISIKKMPLPTFGKYTLRVGSNAGTGDYTLKVKTKALKKPVEIPGVPLTDAGGPYVFEPSTKVILDGSGSTGGITYLWVQVSGPAQGIGNNKALSPTYIAPANRATFAWQLVGKNGAGYSLPSLAVLELDRAPVADAGPSAAVLSGPVTLDGSGSYDLDAGETLRYSWTQVSGPAAAPGDPFAAQPTVNPAADGTFVYSLTVSDGVLSSEPSLVIVTRGASGAAADAGLPVVVRPQDSVFLSGLRSRRADGATPTSFSWTADPSNPAAVTLSGASGPLASFTAPKQPMRLAFRLAVEGNSAGTDEVVVVVTNAITTNDSPAADAGATVEVGTGAPFTLDGSSSHDDGSIQAYEWMQVDGADAGLETAGSSATGDAPGSDAVLRFLLMVHDGRKYGAPDAVQVKVGTPALALSDAGGDQDNGPGANIVLSSALSTPAPGQTITSRQWTQLSGTDWYDVDAADVDFNPTAASPAIRVPTTVSSLSPNRVLLFGLTVTDGSGTSREDLVAVNFLNLPKNAQPQVSASTPNPTYRPGATVALSSTASDGDGDALSYTWTQVSGPAAVITGSTLANASVTAPVATATLVYRVTVSDNTGEGNGTAAADVSFSVNRPPVVVVSSTPASGPAGTEVTLSGATTSDPDDAGLSWSWTEIPPQSGSPVTLNGANTPTATFTQPAYTGSVNARRRTFTLTVTDSMGAAYAVSANVNFSPNKGPNLPTITAAGDRVVFYAGSNASGDKTEALTVSPVFDDDGDPLTFAWSVESGPITSAATLLTATSGTSVTFKSAPKPSPSQSSTGGVYVIGVVATDGAELSPKGKVNLLVVPSWSLDIYPMIAGSCNSGGTCHGSGSAGGLVMSQDAGSARTNLLNGRVTPDDYNASSLYNKLSSGSMPSTGTKWNITNQTDWMLKMVRDWIEPEWNTTPHPGFNVGAANN
jgi:hypothetical protein